MNTINSARIFKSLDFMQPTDGEPMRTVITQSSEAAVIGWYLKPGQRIAAHFHPHGQDTWIVISGGGEYQLEANGESRPISEGDVVVAQMGAVHGVVNTGHEPLIFISVVSPAAAGYTLIES